MQPFCLTQFLIDRKFFDGMAAWNGFLKEDESPLTSGVILSILGNLKNVIYVNTVL